jgi:hypothetical protein
MESQGESIGSVGGKVRCYFVFGAQIILGADTSMILWHDDAP